MTLHIAVIMTSKMFIFMINGLTLVVKNDPARVISVSHVIEHEGLIMVLMCMLRGVVRYMKEVHYVSLILILLV